MDIVSIFLIIPLVLFGDSCTYELTWCTTRFAVVAWKSRVLVAVAGRIAIPSGRAVRYALCRNMIMMCFCR